MKIAPLPLDEDARLRALHDADLLDTPAEAGFDDLAAVASALCGTPIALVSLVDRERQWFKAKVGLDAPETPRDVAFCAHAILGNGVFMVEDAFEDERFADNPLVAGEPHVRFYAGAPLVTNEGHALGTLCVIDHEPRTLDAGTRAALDALGRQVVRMIELRRAHRDLQRESVAREAAQRQVARFFDLSLDLLCVAGVDGTFINLNPAWADVLGHPLDELEGARFLDYVHPEDVEATLAEIAKLEEGATTIGFVNRYRHLSGDYRTLEWRAAPDPESGLLYAAATDVTERVRAAEHTQALLEASATGMVLVDDDGGIVEVNYEAERLLAYGREELVGRDITYLVPTASQDRLRELREEFGVAPMARPIGSGLEFPMLRSDGMEVPVEVALTPLQTQDGSATLITIVDLTARRAIEQVKNEFVSVVSHELRTPLTSIRGSLRLLEAGVKGKLPEGAMQLVGIASSNTERLVRLINDILDIEKIEAGKLHLQLAATDLREVVASAMQAVEGTARAFDVQLSNDVPDGMDVTADADRLTQVLVNLVSNAAKFSPQGGTVHVHASQSAAFVRVEVVDRGPGISMVDQAKLFGKFQQLDTSDTRARGGTGLGLAICKAIVEHHGGRVGVVSEPGAGSTFWFEVPSHRVLETPSSSARLDAGEPPRPVALLVEDDPDAAVVVGTFLQAEGLAVRTAASLEQARAFLLSKDPPAVVFLDLHLPDGNGLQLVEWMRSRSETEETPVIVITGSEPQNQEAMSFLVDWLEKPLDEGALLRAIRRSGAHGAKAKVLIVEDDPSMREIMAEKVLSIGADARTAADGRVALGILQTYRADLIVLDVNLPVVDGFSVVDILRQGSHRATPLLVYSGQDLDQADQEALVLGTTRFVTKAGSDEGAFLRSVRDLLSAVLP